MRGQSVRRPRLSARFADMDNARVGHGWLPGAGPDSRIQLAAAMVGLAANNVDLARPRLNRGRWSACHTRRFDGTGKP